MPRRSGLKFFVMSSDFVDCACTLALQFPDEVYRSAGVSVVLPELLKSVDVPKVRCVQFIRNGQVRVTFDDTACCEAALSNGVMFRGARLPASVVSARSRLVYVRDLPAEVPESFVIDALSSYGTVYSVSAMEHPGYPGLLNGTRLVRVTLEKDIPSSLRICAFDVRVWYKGQPQACIICHSYRHRVKECPLNGLCRRCQQPGHVARECREPRPETLVPQSTLADLLPANDVSDSNDVDFVPIDESESESSIAEDEELLASGDESVLAEETSHDLPPRVSVPVTSKRPLSPTTISVPPSKVPAAKPNDVRPCAPSQEPPSVPSESSDSSVTSPRAVKPKVKPNAKGRSSQKSTSASSESSDVSAVQSTEQPVSSKPPSGKLSDVNPSDVTSSDVKCLRPASVTTYALVFREHDSPCGSSRFDFGHFTKNIIRDKTSFEYDRFIAYVHRGVKRPEESFFGDVSRPLWDVLLDPGDPQKFPGECN